MTFVGKVLVVVQVVLSISFMAFAAAVYTGQNNWKKKHETLVTTSAKAKTDLSEELENIKTENGLLQKAANDANSKAETLQARVEALTQNVTTMTADLNVEKNGNIKEQAVAASFETEAGIRDGEAKTQRVRNDALLTSRRELVKRVQKLEDDKFNSEEVTKKLIEKHNVVLLENATFKKVIAANGLSTNPRDYLDKQAPPPSVKGLVLSTRRGKRSGAEFVEISLGSDDGLLEGHDLHVYRTDEGGKYLGRINIVYVAPDRAVGTLVKRARNGSIQRGDNVTTKL